MRAALRTNLCVLANGVGLLGVFAFTVSAVAPSELFRFGPGPGLKVASVTVETWGLYFGMVAAVCAVRALNTLLHDVAGPALGAALYDPTATVVYGYSKAELLWLANALRLVTAFSSVFQTLVIVSRFDLAVISVLAGELTAGPVVCFLLARKRRFVPDYDTAEDEKAGWGLAALPSEKLSMV